MEPKRQRVTTSFENLERNRCVDIVIRDDGRYGFSEWRREPEDPGNWYPMSDDGGVSYASEQGAIGAARLRVAWFTASDG